jgi:ribose/xylose/arabinose/galactoside ABC-type transport system permease subunit
MPADPYSRDVLSVALLLILASVLIPSWDMARDTLLPMVAAHMASSLLLAAMGFLLALRCGAIDLSVWAVAGLGGVVAAALINSGVGVWPAFAVAGAAGLAVGLLNGGLVGVVGLPSPLVTSVTGMGVIWLLAWLIPGRQITVPEQAFDAYFGHVSGVLAVRVMMVSAVFLAAVVVLAVVDWTVWMGTEFPRRLSLTAALAASGLLAALGGAAFLIDNGLAPVPTRLIDDLRVPAAALLAGGLFLGRRGRELLAGLSLPSALLICTIWRQKAWNLPAPGLGWELQMLVLMGMVIAVHLAFGRYVEARGTGRRLPGVGVLLTVAGIAAVAAAANFRYWPVHDALHLVGIAIWLAGMPAVIISFRRERRLAATGLDGPRSPSVGQYISDNGL